MYSNYVMSFEQNCGVSIKIVACDWSAPPSAEAEQIFEQCFYSSQANLWWCPWQKHLTPPAPAELYWATPWSHFVKLNEGDTGCIDKRAPSDL